MSPLRQADGHILFGRGADAGSGTHKTRADISEPTPAADLIGIQQGIPITENK